MSRKACEPGAGVSVSRYVRTAPGDAQHSGSRLWTAAYTTSITVVMETPPPPQRVAMPSVFPRF